MDMSARFLVDRDGVAISFVLDGVPEDFLESVPIGFEGSPAWRSPTRRRPRAKGKESERLPCSLQIDEIS